MKIKLFAYGEAHHGTHNDEIKKVLNQSKNINGIFLEMSVSFQKHFDEYIKTGIFSDRIEQYIRGASKEGNDIRNQLELIFNFSKDNNVPLIFIDSSKEEEGDYQKKSSIGNWYLKGESRDEDMFNTIKEYVEKSPGGYVLFAGSNHLVNGVHGRSNSVSLGQRLKDWLEEEVKIKIF
ncbi:hypothetical protein N9L18_01110 [Candidatus Pacebacteria bacterium]|nr:hypothetical protein [Candidatus Paceibacterota bacterium]